jgi:hypothetical protein
MTWDPSYSISQIETPEGHYYVTRDKNGKVISRASGITKRINEYFETYQNDFPKQGLNYLSQFTVKEIEQKITRRTAPIQGSRVQFKVGDALRYNTGMTDTQINSYLIQRKAMEEGTVIHAELQDAILHGKTPTHPKARTMWNSFVRAYPPSQYSYESEVPVTDLKKWGTSIDVIVTNKKTGAIGIFDWKTGHEHAPEHTAQLTKEAQMYEMMTGKKVAQLGVIYPNKIQPQRPMAASDIRKIFNVHGSTFKQYAEHVAISDRPYKVQLAQDYLRQLGVKRLPDSFNAKDYSDEVTFLDTETGHASQILQIGAVKGRINYKTGQFEYSDVFERYYYPLHTNTREFKKAQTIHRIDMSVQRQYRRLQNATYGATYGDVDKEALRNFIGDSAVAGHAIMSSDLPWLGLEKIPNSIYDTYHAAQYVYKNERSYGLEALYNKYIGSRKEYHQAFIDALMNAQFGGKMSLRSRRIQWILTHRGLATYPYDAALEGSDVDPFIGKSGIRTTAMGQNIKDYWQGGNMGSDDINEEYDPLENEIGRGMHIEDVVAGSGSGGGQWSELFHAMTEAINHMDSYAKTVNAMSENLTDSIQGYNLTTNRRMMQNIVHKYDESDWDEALREELGVSGMGVQTWHTRLSGMKRREEHGAMVKAQEEVQRAVDKGLISRAQADTIQRAANSVQDLNDALEQQIKNNAVLRQSLSSMKFFDLNTYSSAVHQEWGGIKHAAQGVIPSWFAKPIGRFGDAFMNVFNRNMARYNAGKGVIDNVVSPVLQGVGGAAGFALGGPGSAIGGMALGKSIAAGITQIWGHTATAKTALRGERIQEVLNISGGIIDMIMIPVRMIGRIIGTLVRLFGALAGAVALGINSMKQLATPLTSLTGVHFPMQQGLEAAGHLTGLGKDAYGNAYNTFANEAQALYTTGQLNRDRLVAASMLGVFGDVYNPTADADEMYGGTVNKILAQMRNADPTRQKQLMTLAGRVDSTLPQTLQVMKDLGITDWKQMRTYAGYSYFRPHSDSERTLYRRQSFQFQGNIESMMNSVRRIASRLWELGGKHIMDFLNRLLDGLALALDKIKDPQKALEQFKATLSTGWKALKDALGFKNGFGSILDKISEAIRRFAPVIIDVAAMIAKAIVHVWFKALDAMMNKGGIFLDYLNTLRIVKDKDSPLGYKLAIGSSNDFQGAWKRSQLLSYNGGVQFENASGDTFRPATLGTHGENNQLWGRIDQWTDAFTKYMHGGWASFTVGKNKLRLTNTHASTDAYERWMSLFDEYRQGKIDETRLYSTLYNERDLMNLFDYEGKASIRSYYEAVKSGQHVDFSDSESTIMSAIDVARDAAKESVVNLNISVNDKPMFNVKATDTGVTVAGGAQRYDIGGYVIKTDVQQSLAQLGLQRR